MGQQSADMCGLPAAGFTFDPPNLHSAIMTGLVRLHLTHPVTALGSR